MAGVHMNSQDGQTAGKSLTIVKCSGFNRFWRCTSFLKHCFVALYPSILSHSAHPSTMLSQVDVCTSLSLLFPIACVWAKLCCGSMAWLTGPPAQRWAAALSYMHGFLMGASERGMKDWLRFKFRFTSFSSCRMWICWNVWRNISLLCRGSFYATCRVRITRVFGNGRGLLVRTLTSL